MFVFLVSTENSCDIQRDKPCEIYFFKYVDLVFQRWFVDFNFQKQELCLSYLGLFVNPYIIKTPNGELLLCAMVWV